MARFGLLLFITNSYVWLDIVKLNYQIWRRIKSVYVLCFCC
jgi:hypothetical protein